MGIILGSYSFPTLNQYDPGCALVRMHSVWNASDVQFGGLPFVSSHSATL